MGQGGVASEGGGFGELDTGVGGAEEGGCAALENQDYGEWLAGESA